MHNPTILPLVWRQFTCVLFCGTQTPWLCSLQKYLGPLWTNQSLLSLKNSTSLSKHSHGRVNEGLITRVPPEQESKPWAPALLHSPENSTWTGKKFQQSSKTAPHPDRRLKITVQSKSKEHNWNSLSLSQPCKSSGVQLTLNKAKNTTKVSSGRSEQHRAQLHLLFQEICTWFLNNSSI